MLKTIVTAAVGALAGGIFAIAGVGHADTGLPVPGEPYWMTTPCQTATSVNCYDNGATDGTPPHWVRQFKARACTMYALGRYAQHHDFCHTTMPTRHHWFPTGPTVEPQTRTIVRHRVINCQAMTLTFKQERAYVPALHRWSQWQDVALLAWSSEPGCSQPR